MGWMGKLLGGTIGFVLGGPLGAIAGTVFGHSFDKISSNQPYKQNSYINQQRSQMTFFVGAFSMLAKIAQADGQVTKSEINSIENFMSQDLRLDYSSRQVALKIFNSALHSGESFDNFARQFYEQFNTQPQILEMILDILIRVSVADRILSRPEEEMILNAVRIFNFPDSRYTAIRQKYVRDDSRYYSVLGCSKCLLKYKGEEGDSFCTSFLCR